MYPLSIVIVKCADPLWYKADWLAERMTSSTPFNLPKKIISIIKVGIVISYKMGEVEKISRFVQNQWLKNLSKIRSLQKKLGSVQA